MMRWHFFFFLFFFFAPRDSDSQHDSKCKFKEEKQIMLLCDFFKMHFIPLNAHILSTNAAFVIIKRRPSELPSTDCYHTVKYLWFSDPCPTFQHLSTTDMGALIFPPLEINHMYC